MDDAHDDKVIDVMAEFYYDIIAMAEEILRLRAKHEAPQAVDYDAVIDTLLQEL